MRKQMNPNQAGQESTKQETAAHQIRRVVAVMSGKGGVGKSFVTGLLASELAKKGYQVGILDADITGPSIPTLFGLHGPVKAGEDGIEPLCSRAGIKIISMNFLLASEDQPVIWRGPMISKAIKQLWTDVAWGNLDYLLVDLPPGTSDAALTIMQSLPVKGIVMVTTPQGLATMIVRKAVRMAQSVGVPITGVVENMAYYICPDTGKKHYVFGQCRGDTVAMLANAPILAQIPLNPTIAKLCDFGKIEDVALEESQALIDRFIKTMPVQAPEDTASGSPLQKVSLVSPDELPAENSGLTQRPVMRTTFSEKARRLIASRENLGCLENPDARGKFRGWCGDSMQVDLRLANGTIQAAKFMTDGCGATIACGSMVTQMACSKTLDEALQITPEEVLAALEGLPDDHQHCATLAVTTLREAVKNAIEGKDVPRDG